MSFTRLETHTCSKVPSSYPVPEETYTKVRDEFGSGHNIGVEVPILGRDQYGVDSGTSILRSSTDIYKQFPDTCRVTGIGT